MGQQLEISRILHAGYIFKSDRTTIAFDPIFENPFSKNCYAFPNVEFDVNQIQRLELDAVFISHYHDDHCSLESLNLLHKSTPIYVYCQHDELFEMIKQLGFQNVYSLRLNKPILVGEFTITPRRALDEDVDSLFQIQTENLNILNVVDSWIDPETLTLLKDQPQWDLILWPFQTMREIEVITQKINAPPELPEEWTEQLQTLNPKFLVPSSCQFRQEEWSWYNNALFPITYKKFEEEINKIIPNTKVVRLNPSVSIKIKKDKDQPTLHPAPALTWITPLGDQNVDYDFKPNEAPPDTADIARNFAPLTDEQTQRPLRFANSEIIDRFEQISEDPYFDKPRHWQLAIYDHTGAATIYQYELANRKLTRSDLTTPPDWTTEVPIATLYGALEKGESLTSMYVRISNAQYEDIVDDPLIASLFNGRFGAYQKVQLENLNQIKSNHL